MDIIPDAELRDITPNPRILRTLGEIPYHPWQCIAELVDNSLDALLKLGDQDHPRRVVVSWSREAVGEPDRQLQVIDTGPGMTLDQIQDAVRAGYTSNDPVSTLGLFGMGFNIATARLGDRTTFLSTCAGAPEWVGIEIDFSELTRSGQFRAPVRRISKTNPADHGTWVIASHLKPGIFDALRRSANAISKTLADLYSAILTESDIEILVQGKLLQPRRHCTWAPSRSVTLPRSQETIPAVLDIDETLGDALFNVELNRYLTPDEEDLARLQSQTGDLPDGVVIRTKRIHGWLGIQRYPHPSDFGIDFIRNGRKILRSDKSLFSYRNEMSGQDQLEYPVELGATVGGRIVGEIFVDHVPPTYQKNDFDRTDPSWYEVVSALRGVGPIRPQGRRDLGYQMSNDSPLARLIRAYGECRPGTRYLGTSNNRLAREWAELYHAGDPRYQADDLWWEAAREADRERADKGAAAAPEVDSGGAPSDDVEEFGPGAQPVQIVPGGPGAAQGQGAEEEEAPPAQPDTEATLKPRARQVLSESGRYSYPGCPSPFEVKVWEVTRGIIRTADPDEEGAPSVMFRHGNECTFFYNPQHRFLRQHPTTEMDLLLVQVADLLKIRDRLPDIGTVFVQLLVTHCDDRRVDRSRLQEEAEAFFDRLRDDCPDLLSLREQEALGCVHEAIGEVEDIVSALLHNPELLDKFQRSAPGGIGALAFAPGRTLVRLVERFPEEFLDAKFFRTPYNTIVLQDPNATERLRAEAKDRLLSFLKDAWWVISEMAPRQSKLELQRCAHSLAVLQRELAP